MKCIVCGKEILALDKHKKYCPECAKAVAKQRQESYREIYRALKDVPRYCKRCGAPVGAKRIVCDACKVEHEREYQREYHRRWRRAKK